MLATLDHLADADRATAEVLADDAWTHDATGGTAPGPRILGDDYLPQVLPPWQLLLDAAEGDGIPVTDRGYLRPAVVTHLFDELGLAATWPGRGNRERDLPQVRGLRRSCRLMGLTRTLRGRVVLTRAGVPAQADPRVLWGAVAAGLGPAGDGSIEADATALALLHLAAGLPFGDATERAIGEALGRAGHRNGERHPDPYDIARAVSEPAQTLGWLVGDPFALGLLEHPAPAQRALARAALFGV